MIEKCTLQGHSIKYLESTYKTSPSHFTETWNFNIFKVFCHQADKLKEFLSLLGYNKNAVLFNISFPIHFHKVSYEYITKKSPP
jgi:hypothetical protein